MSTLALPLPASAPGRHRSTRPRSMSTTAWRHVRAGLTATIVVAATVGGVAVGVGGATVSPVSVAPVSVATPAPTASDPGPTADGPGGGADGSGHGSHHHR